MLIPLDLIDSNPWQPRTQVDDSHIADLAASIETESLIHPPVVRATSDGRYQIAVGHNRKAACALLGRAEMECDLRPLTDRQMSDMAAAENARRRDLSAIEKARAIKRRMDDFQLTQLEAARPFGYTDAGTVSNLLRLLEVHLRNVQRCLTANAESHFAEENEGDSGPRHVPRPAFLRPLDPFSAAFSSVVPLSLSSGSDWNSSSGRSCRPSNGSGVRETSR